MSDASPRRRYVMPTSAVGRLAGRLLNGSVAALTRWGVPVAGSRVLAVRGRASGQWRTTPVNPLTLDGVTYLLAPRGHTQWVRNLRAAGQGELRVGRRAVAFTAVELADTEKPPIMREYLRRWKWEVGQFFDDLDEGSDEARLLAAAPGFPVFRVSETAA
jgi:deazaflavin-dependent oxidoreductase (nitroreductase family)